MHFIGSPDFAFPHMTTSLTSFGFKVSAPPASIRFDADKNCQKFENMVIEGKIDEEMVAAMTYAETNVACTPAGKSTGLKDADELKCN